MNFDSMCMYADSVKTICSLSNSFTNNLYSFFAFGKSQQKTTVHSSLEKNYGPLTINHQTKSILNNQFSGFGYFTLLNNNQV